MKLQPRLTEGQSVRVRRQLAARDSVKHDVRSDLQSGQRYQPLPVLIAAPLCLDARKEERSPTVYQLKSTVTARNGQASAALNRFWLQICGHHVKDGLRRYVGVP